MGESGADVLIVKLNIGIVVVIVLKYYGALQRGDDDNYLPTEEPANKYLNSRA